MGKPNIRLNPKVESVRTRTLLTEATTLLLAFAMLLPAKRHGGRGRRPFDYRIVLVLSILRHLLRKRYADYETEMRTDKRLMDILDIKSLPCKSTLNYYDLKSFSPGLLSRINALMIADWIKKPLDLLLDASGIRLVGRSIWYCIRTKKRIRRKDCDKVHIGISLCSLLIVNFAISNSKRNDSPFLRVLLKPFEVLGIILADKGYSNKTNTLFVTKRKGGFFSPFKKNVCPSGLNDWARIYKLWQVFPSLCRGVYNQRNKVEAVFSALKRRYGDQLYCRKWYSRRREMCMRFVAYNVKIILGIRIARQKGIPLWVRA